VFSRASLSSSRFPRCSIPVVGDIVTRERDGRPDRRTVSPLKLNRPRYVSYYYRDLCARELSTLVSHWRAVDDHCCDVVKPVEFFIFFPSKFSTRSLTLFAVISDPMCTFVWRWRPARSRFERIPSRKCSNYPYFNGHVDLLCYSFSLYSNVIHFQINSEQNYQKKNWNYWFRFSNFSYWYDMKCHSSWCNLVKCH